MKALLEFDLPDDEAAFRSAANAVKWRDVVYQMAEYLRGRAKHSNEPEQIIYQEVRDQLWDELRERGIDPYEYD